jgi:hypothetical protein
MKDKRDNKLQLYLKEEAIKWLPLSEKEKYLSGLFLYWGEGNKSQRHIVSINNTDPSVMWFSLNWYLDCLHAPKNKIKVQLHLYRDMDIKKEIRYWSGILGLGRSHFNKPYIKMTNRNDIDQKGFGHGTCGIVYCNTEIKERILMAIKAISEVYEKYQE